MAVRNYTTQIAVEKTIMEIEQILVKFGYAYNVVENKTMYQKFVEKKEEYLALEEKRDEAD